jgi:predicted MFS family arabinose efflux permease
VASTFLLVINPVPNAAFIMLSIYGFTLAPIWALMVTNLQQQLGPLHGANAIGFMLAAAGIGIGVFSGIGGFIADRNSLEAVPMILFALSIMMMILYEAAIRRRVNTHRSS